MRGSAIFLVLLFVFASRAQCKIILSRDLNVSYITDITCVCCFWAGRPHHQLLTGGTERKNYPYVLPQEAISNNATALDGSKLTIIFCTKNACDESPLCYCCEALKSKPCYSTIEECQHVCPVCDPKCLPAYRLGASPYLNFVLIKKTSTLYFIGKKIPCSQDVRRVEIQGTAVEAGLHRLPPVLYVFGSTDQPCTTSPSPMENTVYSSLL
jgi:hypothetical protein